MTENGKTERVRECQRERERERERKCQREGERETERGRERERMCCSNTIIFSRNLITAVFKKIVKRHGGNKK